MHAREHIMHFSQHLNHKTIAIW